MIPNCHLDSLPIVISSEVEKSNEISPLTTFGRDDQKREGVNSFEVHTLVYFQIICLIILQNLSWHQADVLADAVQTAECINCGVALAGNGLKGLTFLHLVEVGLRSK